MKEQWRQGLQWGAVGAVARWIAPHLAGPLYELTGAEEAHLLYQTILVVVGILIFGGIALTWSRVSRAALLIGIAWVFWHGASDAGDAAKTPAYAAASFIFSQHADVLPLLPLLFLTPEQPRLTLAMGLMGRWRDAARTLAGWRWVPVAVAVLFVDLFVAAIERSIGAVSYDHQPAGLLVDPGALAAAIAPLVALAGASLLPSWRSRSTARPWSRSFR